MKKFIISIFNNEIFLTVILALLLGMFLGVMYNSAFFTPIKVKLHSLYLQINPDAQKDSQTLIIEKVTINTPNINQKDIFTEPKKQDCKILCIIKKLIPTKETPANINSDYIIK